jgi:hypothetical protein
VGVEESMGEGFDLWASIFVTIYYHPYLLYFFISLLKTHPNTQITTATTKTMSEWFSFSNLQKEIKQHGHSFSLTLLQSSLLFFFLSSFLFLPSPRFLLFVIFFCRKRKVSLSPFLFHSSRCVVHSFLLVVCCCFPPPLLFAFFSIGKVKKRKGEGEDMR